MKPEVCKNCPLYSCKDGPVDPYVSAEESIVVIGEAPGLVEVRHNQPFIGPMGRVLRAIMLKGGLNLDNCTVTNTVWCRPPGGRTPTNEERDYCFTNRTLPFLKKFLHAKWLCVGSVASKALLGETITHTNGYLFSNPYGGNKIVGAIYHPRYVMESGREISKEVEEAFVKFLKTEAILDPTDSIKVNPPIMALKDFVDEAEKAEYIVLDLETTGLSSTSGITICGLGLPDGKVVSVRWNDQTKAVLKSLLTGEGKTFIIHNVGFDAPVLYNNGIDIFDNKLVDTLLLAQLLGNKKKSLEALGGRYLATTSWKKKAGLEGKGVYNGKDVYYTNLVYQRMERDLFKVSRPLWDQIKDVPKIAAKMHVRGIKLDIVKLNALQKKTSNELEQGFKDWHAIWGDVNPFSPKQLSELFTKAFGERLPKVYVTGGKRKESTNEKALQILRLRSPQLHMVVDQILNLRNLNKFLKTYVEIEYDDNGIVHPHFNVAGTITGRWSSSKPNLQNIPPRFRGIFVPRPGHVFLEPDYSQAETRIIAMLSNEQHMLDAWDEGKDIHIFNASKVFAVDYDKVTPEQRQMAKTVIYAMSYGSGPGRIAEKTGRPFKYVKQFMHDFKELFPSYSGILEHWASDAQEHGYLTTPFGFVHHFYGKRIYTQAKNFIPQSSVSSIINIVLCQIVERFPTKLHPLAQVHDSLLLEISEELDREEVAAEIKQIMEQPWECLGNRSIPVHLNWGETWGECK